MVNNRVIGRYVHLGTYAHLISHIPLDDIVGQNYF